MGRLLWPALIVILISRRRQTVITRKWIAWHGLISRIIIWTGERGESTFVSNKDEVRKILDDVNLEGIEYENAIPDFSPVSKG